MKFRTVLGVVLAVSLPAAALRGEEIAWHTDLAEARAAAEEKNLPLLIYFTSSHCPHCVRMQQTFAAASVHAQVSAGFVALRIDYDTDPATCKSYGVRGFPTTVLVRPDQVELRRVVGYQRADQFLGTLRQAAAVAVAAREKSTVK